MIAFRHVLFVLPAHVIPLHGERVRVTLARLLPAARLSFASGLAEVPEPCDADVLVAPQVDWLAQAVARCPALRWLHLLTAGSEAIAEAGLQRRVGWITKSSGVNAAAIAEYVLAAALWTAKRFPQFLEQQRRHEWKRCWLDELAGRRAVVVGMGSVGGAIAERLGAAGYEVCGVSRRARPHPHTAVVLPPHELGRAADGADLLAVAAPLTPATRGLVDRAVLLRLRQGAVLVDVSRGGIVVAGAIAELAASGHLGYAVLDVFEREPLPLESPLWSLPNVLITPHVAGTSNLFMDRALAILEQNLASLAAFGKPVTPVDADAGY